MCSISLEGMKKPTSVLAVSEENGYASVQTYEKDHLFKWVGLDPIKNTRDELTKKCNDNYIKDPNTLLRIIEPRRDYVKEEEMKILAKQFEEFEKLVTANLQESQPTSSSRAYKIHKL